MVQSNLGPENRVQQSELLEMNNKIKSYNSQNSLESSSVASGGGQHQQKMQKPAIIINESYNPSNSNKYNKANRMVSDIICSMSGVCCLS
jgi:predicted transglutaminase-like protease